MAEQDAENCVSEFMHGGSDPAGKKNIHLVSNRFHVSDSGKAGKNIQNKSENEKQPQEPDQLIKGCKNNLFQKIQKTVQFTHMINFLRFSVG
jgi:hypothetical protein